MFGTTPRFWHPARPYGRGRKAASLLPQRRQGERSLLLVASHPGDMLALANPAAILGRYSRVGVWIIDSFWDERIPLFARRRHGVDAVWITDGELCERYSTAMSMDVGWLPWGTDALAQWEQPPVDRVIDVLRLGRQPRSWDDDELNSTVLASAGLTYRGRFPDAGTGSANQAVVQRMLASSKVALASSPLASPGCYTHPTRDYISARFTDAAAAGTPVAGQPPRGLATGLLPRRLLVPMDISTRNAGLSTLREAVTRHDEELASELRREALKTLDWRHRFAVIAARLEVSALALNDDLARLRGHLESRC